MWPFKKKIQIEETSEKKPKKKIWEKVVMGAIVGGAIGSVLGASIAPKKGSETREDIGEIAKKAKKSSGIFFRRFKKMLKPKGNSEESVKKIPHERTP